MQNRTDGGPAKSLSPSRLQIKRETLSNCLGRLIGKGTNPLPVGAGQ